MNLSDKLNALQFAVSRLSAGARAADSQKSSLTWKEIFGAVKEAEIAMKAVRAVIRKNATKEKRDGCSHPDRNRDQHGVCGACRKPGLDPGPALALCACGAARWQHDSSDKERLVVYLEGQLKKCEGFDGAYKVKSV